MAQTGPGMNLYLLTADRGQDPVGGVICNSARRGEGHDVLAKLEQYVTPALTTSMTSVFHIHKSCVPARRVRELYFS